MGTAMNKTLDYYLSLPYTIEIIPDLEDGGWVVKIKELRGCITQADHWEDILPMIQDAKKLWLESAIEDGAPSPNLSVNRLSAQKPASFKDRSSDQGQGKSCS